VLVELDGEHWRTIPLGVAARSGLTIGLELDRERLRTLRRELRRGDAVAAGTQALARYDRSEQGLRDILKRKGIGEREREEAIAALRRHGALDDKRFAEAEVRARLRDDLPLEPRVEHRSLPGDSRAVDDVEFGLFERRRDLVLDHLDANTVAVGLDAFLERLDPSDVETNRRVELQGAATWSGLRRSEHHPNLLAELVREDADRVGAVERAGELAQRLRHQPRLQPDVAVPHLALDLGLGRQRRDRIHGHDVEGAGADQQLRDLEGLLASVGLGHEQVVDVDAYVLRVGGIHRVLGVDEGADASAPLSLRDHVVDEGRLARGLRAEDLDDPPAGEAADSEREVERERPGRDGANRHRRGIVHLHHGALAEGALDLSERCIQCLLAIHL